MNNLKQFALFYQSNKVELCGIDGFLPIDGRYNLYNCCKVARKHGLNLKRNLHKDILYFRIFKGNLKHNTPISNFKLLIPI